MWLKTIQRVLTFAAMTKKRESQRNRKFFSNNKNAKSIERWEWNVEKVSKVQTWKGFQGFFWTTQNLQKKNLPQLRLRNKSSFIGMGINMWSFNVADRKWKRKNVRHLFNSGAQQCEISWTRINKTSCTSFAVVATNDSLKKVKSQDKIKVSRIACKKKKSLRIRNCRSHEMKWPNFFAHGFSQFLYTLVSANRPWT